MVLFAQVEKYNLPLNTHCHYFYIHHNNSTTYNMVICVHCNSNNYQMNGHGILHSEHATLVDKEDPLNKLTKVHYQCHIWKEHGRLGIEMMSSSYVTSQISFMLSWSLRYLHGMQKVLHGSVSWWWQCWRWMIVSYSKITNNNYILTDVTIFEIRIIVILNSHHDHIFTYITLCY